MKTDLPWRNAICLLSLTLLFLTAVAPDADAQRARRSRSRTAEAASEDSAGDYQARTLLRRASDLLVAGEDERGTKILEEIVKQYPQSPVRYEAYLALGRHFIEAHDQVKAIYYLNNLKQIEADHRDEEIPPELVEIYLEGMYHTGVSLFHMRQFSSAFPVLRKITDDYPNTVWANQAYYYIGMCHFAQSNWNKAIEALSVVGTFVDPESPTVQYVEAGHRFYIKIDDTDLPVLHRMGKKVLVEVSAPSGDKETVECIPLSGNDQVFVGSIPTELGTATQGDNKLQIIGGDKIQTVYLDENTREGAKDMQRNAAVEVVSTAAVNFTLGDYQTVAKAAFLGQPLFVTLNDADLDVSPNADSVQVRIVSRFKEQQDAGDDSGRNVDIDRLFATEEERFIVRDEVLVTLSELGTAPIRTGRFAAKVELATFSEGQPPDKSDAILSCALDDEILVTYIDELHIQGRSPREVEASARIADEINSYPQVQQMVVSDPVIAARKNVVEATAYLELARIFKSMGLTKGAGEKADEGLERVDAIISKREPIPLELKEQAFKLKWELYLAKDDLAKAIATCRVFSKAFPNSSFVDQALMGIAAIKVQEGELREAMSIYHQVLALPNSQAKAEAQFRIAQAFESESNQRGARENAIAEYKKCASNYPDSEYAGESLAKLVDYQIETKDYSQANDLLEQVFTDYPDAVFLDSMLLKWVMVAYRMGDFQTAYDKCSELVFQYPTSPFAEKAKDILPKIEQRINR